MSNEHPDHPPRAGVIVLDGFLAGSIFTGVSMNEYIMMLSEIRTFSHHYKSNSNNSKRLRLNTEEGIAEAIRSSELWSRWTLANNDARLSKLLSLPSITPEPGRCMPLGTVRDPRKPVFFSGEDTCQYGKDRIPRGGVYLPARQTLEVVDSTNGFHLKGVCTLIRRDEALSTFPKGQRKRLFNAFTRMSVAGKSNSRVSSRSRVALEDKSGAGKYVAEGVYAARNRKGLAIHTLNEGRCDKARRCISHFFRNLEERAKGYIDARQLLFLEAVRRRSDYGNLSLHGGPKSAIWPSVAFGRNVFLRVHRDEDYFWSLTTVVTKDGYEKDGEIVNYFCFPTYGFCIALRPGDALIFNALVDHCASSICQSNTKAYGVSLYLKTAVVAGNDNSS
jgi:hypothetical protein